MSRLCLVLVLLAACSEPVVSAPELQARTCAVHSEAIVYGREPATEPPGGYVCIWGVTDAEFERSQAWESAYRDAYAAEFPNRRSTRKSVRDGQVVVKQCLTCSGAERQWLSDHPRDG